MKASPGGLRPKGVWRSDLKRVEVTLTRNLYVGLVSKEVVKDELVLPWIEVWKVKGLGRESKRTERLLIIPGPFTSLLDYRGIIELVLFDTGRIKIGQRPFKRTDKKKQIDHHFRSTSNDPTRGC